MPDANAEEMNIRFLSFEGCPRDQDHLDSAGLLPARAGRDMWVCGGAPRGAESIDKEK